MVYFGGCMYCTNDMFTVLFFNGLCTSNVGLLRTHISSYDYYIEAAYVLEQVSLYDIFYLQ